MSVTNIEDEVLSPRSVEEPGSARKRSRLDSSRKNWSLTENLNDEESLLEMGVSFLEPDNMSSTCDVETHTSQQKTGTKRKRDLENVNPNVNSAHLFTHKSPRRSPKSKQSPAPNSGQVLSSPSSAKYLESSLQQPYITEEETPEAQVVEYRQRRGFEASPVAVRERETQDVACPSLPLASGADSFAAFSDEVMLSVFRWLPKRALAHAMLVCKRWRRVCSDESFWQRLELGNRSLSRGALGKILARQPVALRLAASEIGAWHPTDPSPPCRLQYLDLSMCVVDTHTLAALLARCPKLKKLSLEATSVDDEVCRLIGKCSNMETLNLTMAKGITSTGLGYILDGCTSLHSLNISWCGLCADSLTALSERAPQTLQRLNMAGARLASTETVAALVPRLPRLVELDLSDCSRLGAAAVAAVTRLSRLEHLALSRCYLLPPHALTRLSMMPGLQYLEVWGMLQDASLAALRHALPAIQLNQFMHSAADSGDSEDFDMGTTDEGLIGKPSRDHDKYL